MPTRFECLNVTDDDEYIKAIVRQLADVEEPLSLSAILLICNMALDHTVASPDLLEMLERVRKQTIMAIESLIAED